MTVGKLAYRIVQRGAADRRELAEHWTRRPPPTELAGIIVMLKKYPRLVPAVRQTIESGLSAMIRQTADPTNDDADDD